MSDTSPPASSNRPVPAPRRRARSVDAQLRLAPHQLRLQWDPSRFDFQSTAELTPLDGLLAQGRAVEALRFALTVDHPQFNCFVAGPTGTGKSTLVPRMARAAAADLPRPPDLVYVYHFEKPDRPRALLLPAGRGRIFVQAMKRLVETLQRDIPTALSTRDFRSRQQALYEGAVDQRRVHLELLEERARAIGIAVEDSAEALQLVPLREDGVRMTPEEFEALEESDRKAIEERERTLRDDILEYLDHAQRIQRATDEQLSEHDRKTVLRVVQPAMERVRRKVGAHDGVKAWLAAMQEDVLDNLDRFVPDEDGSPMDRMLQPETAPERYEVHLVVDNHETVGAPVLVERNPTYSNLIGKVERRMRLGVLETNHTLLRAGSLVRASGGFLIVNARDLVLSPYAWPALKRALREERVVLEDPDDLLTGPNSAGLEPEPIQIQTRVLLVGTLDDYLLLREADEDFDRLFRIRADFEDTTDLDDETALGLARYAAARTRDRGLLPLSADGTAALVEFASRCAGRRDQLTLQLATVGDLLVEADHYARLQQQTILDRQSIEDAAHRRADRNGMLRDRMQREFSRGTLLVNVTGTRVGQINGLAVLGFGDGDFGFPSRITARSFAGSGDVLNIERETDLGGQIHSKATLILQGWLSAVHASEQSLCVDASITFEQNYHFIEGDSATAAEAVALLSSIGQVAVRQDLAITGSMSQYGEIQPIGGVNEKVEGFFDVCARGGLTGSQGVIIPRRNAEELHLLPRVVAAIEAGTFHVYAVDHIDEALSLLLGMPAGRQKRDGTWPARSVHGRVALRLRELAERREARGDRQDDEPTRSASSNDSAPTPSPGVGDVSLARMGRRMTPQLQARATAFGTAVHRPAQLLGTSAPLESASRSAKLAARSSDPRAHPRNRRA